MKTFADLKRDLQVGVKLKKVFQFGNTSETVKTVSKVQTNGVYLDKSWLSWPTAALVEYDGVNIKIYDEGSRDVTDEERKIMANEPSRRPENAKQVEIDALTDGNQMYWADKRYYKELGAEYLRGMEWENGERYDSNKDKIKSKKIKGELVLQYIVLKNESAAA